MAEATSVRSSSRRAVERSLLYALFVLIMFEPMCLFYMEQGSRVFEFVDNAWKMLAIYVSLAVILLLWWKRTPDRWVYPIVLLCLIACVSVAVNEGAGRLISQMGRGLGYVALAWFLHDRMQRDKRHLINGLLAMLAFYTLCSFLSIAITQHVGLVPGTRTPVYFFGQKNMIFIYGMPLIAVMIVRDFMIGASISYATIAISILYSMVSLYIDSASSTVCFAAISVALVYLKIKRKPSKVFHPAVFISLIVGLFVVTIIQQKSSGVIGSVLELLGRSTTFSGRTPAWDQAIQYFMESPLIGQGESLVFTLAYGVEVSSAHSFYLASLAQYGILYFAVLVADILSICEGVLRRPSVFVCIESILFFILMLHSLYDIMYINNYIIIRAIVVCAMTSFDEKRIIGHANN